MENVVQKQRIQYIDSLRGFAMLLVVIHHVSLYSFDTHPAFSINSVFLTFRMPLFFFLSGFLFFKPNLFVEKDGYNQFLLKKFKVQILPTIIFGTFFAFIMSIPAADMVFHQTKRGYWFTIVLFIYFFFFASSSYFCRKYMDYSEKRSLLIIFISALFLSIPSFLSDLYSFHIGYKYLEWFSTLLSFNKWWYYVFFVFGAIGRWKGWQLGKLQSSPFIAIVIVMEFLLLIIRTYFGSTSPFCLYGTVDFFLGFLGIIIVVSFFAGNENVFSKDHILGRSLQYMGVRTLDIYLLHYFFVPRNLMHVGRWFEEYCNPIVELSVELLLAVAVILFCLVASRILRCSDFLAKWLFGKII